MIGSIDGGFAALTEESFKVRLSVILASASPRRRQLLTQAGYDFEVVVPDVDESVFSAAGVGTCEYAEQLALAKAKSVADRYPDCLVIGADTIADFNGEIIGKAADAKEAEQITRKLFGGPHKVKTGAHNDLSSDDRPTPHRVTTAVAIVRLNDGIEVVESDTTTIYPKTMTESQIAEHIKSGAWKDKAGAYAIQENDEFVERIEGSLTNVMGMPMELLQRLLERITGEARPESSE